MFTIAALLEALGRMNISQNRLAQFLGSNASTINGWIRKNIRPSRDSHQIGEGINDCRLVESSWKNTSLFVERLIEELDATPREKHYLKRKYDEFRRMDPSEKGSGLLFLDHLARLALEQRELGSALEYEPFNPLQPVVGIGAEHIIVALDDGRVNAAGANDYEQCATHAWRDVIAVAAGWRSSVGLRKDGTCVAVGNKTGGNGELFRWRDLAAVCCGAFHFLGLKIDGTVNAFGIAGEGQCNVSGWNHIRALAAGAAHSVGLREDGTVVAAGSNKEGQCEVAGWKNVVRIAAAGEYTVGLTDKGDVLFAGDRYIYDFSGWKDIQSIAAGTYHVAGLKKDGTVLQTGNSIGGLDQVSRWWDVKAIFAGYNTTAGIQANGNVLVTQDRSARTYLRSSPVNIYGEKVQADGSASPYERTRKQLIGLFEKAYGLGLGMIPFLRAETLPAEGAALLEEIIRLTKEAMDIRERIPGVRLLTDPVMTYGEAFLDFRNTLAFRDGAWVPSRCSAEKCEDFVTAVRMVLRDLRSDTGL